MSKQSKENKWVDWEQPGDPVWVADYLKALRSGKTIKAACMIARVDGPTTTRWRKRDTKNALRHTQALAEARERGAIWIDDVLKTQAEKGSTWHLARRAVHLNHKLWKDLNSKLRDAEPDVNRHEVSGGGAPQYEVVMTMEDVEENTLDDVDS